MPSGLSLVPASLAFVDDQISSWLGDLGRSVPDGAHTSQAPTIGVLRAVLVDLGWAFSEIETDSAWIANEEPTDGAWPPFSELALHNPRGESPDRHWSFQLGPLEGAAEIARRVARISGCQIATHHSYGYPCVITPDTSTDLLSHQLQGR